jgi:hypothetical protein
MEWLEELPSELLNRAYRHGTEAAWDRTTGLRVIDYVSLRGRRIVGIEVWLPSSGAPTIPSRFFYGWTEPELTADRDVRLSKANDLARNYIMTFSWDPRDTAVQKLAPYFNFTVA